MSENLLTWVGYVSPNVSQGSPCVTSSLNIDFPNHEREFTVDAFIGDIDGLKFVRSPALLDVITTEVFIREEMEAGEGQGLIQWDLVTQPAIFNPEGMSLALDSLASTLNGAPLYGTVFLFGDEEGNLLYQMPQALLGAQPPMPQTDGHLPLKVEMNIYLNGFLALHQNFETSGMTTDVDSATSPVLVAFDDNTFSGSFTIQQRRNHAARRLRGSIDFADANNQIVSNMAFRAEIDGFGNVFGALLGGSHVNETPVAAYVSGSWFCDNLTINLENGSYQGECGLSIPSLQAGVLGTFRVEQLEE